MSRLSSKKSYQLYDLLARRSEGYYSLGIKGVSRKLDIDIDLLRALGDWESRPGKKFHYLQEDYINVFKYGNIEYIGLESRRLHYERDEIRGTNSIADAVKRGDYD